MTRRYFGTDGVRGPYGGPVVNESFVARLGAAAAGWSPRWGKALIGRDTRASGVPLTEALAQGLRDGGLVPENLGVMPTPAVARAVVLSGAALGAVVTASHNPASDNGLKFFRQDGRKLSDHEEAAIEAGLGDGASERGKDPVCAESGAACLEAYIDAVLALLPPDSLRGWRIALDTANGATCVTSPVVLRKLGATVTGLGDAPDGRNINERVGSEHPEALAAAVRGVEAHLGIAHDGDGDRCVLCDEQGGILDGDEILTILALDALARGTLKEKTLVVTVQSNLGVDAAVTAAGGRVVRTSVGDRYVAERLAELGAGLGGESSGHIILPEISPAGDGLVAAVKVIGVMGATGRPLSQLRRALRKFPQASDTLTVREKRPIEELPQLRAAMAAVERELGESGRLLVRYSGTEPKLRFLVEGTSQEAIGSALARLKAAASSDLR